MCTGGNPSSYMPTYSVQNTTSRCEPLTTYEKNRTACLENIVMTVFFEQWFLYRKYLEILVIMAATEGSIQSGTFMLTLSANSF